MPARIGRLKCAVEEDEVCRESFVLKKFCL